MLVPNCLQKLRLSVVEVIVQSSLEAADILDGDIVKQITDYIAIPAKSPTFDSDWAQHGFIDTVMRNAASWVEAQKVEGLTLEIVRLEGRPA